MLEASDGRQALTVLQGAAPVNLVVCDSDMPEMDGMEFFRHMGQAHNEASVIISSAQERSLLDSVEKMALAYGVRLLGVIEKPVTLDALEDLIARLGLHGPQPSTAVARVPGFSLDEILEGIHRKQFKNVYQPKTGLKTGRVVGAEALARWNHPVHGVIGPEAFIAPLEQSEKIDELTMPMLAQAAHACRRWRQRGLELRMSVNLSLVSLADTTLADRVTQVVRSAGVKPSHLILEITETAAMTDVGPLWRT